MFCDAQMAINVTSWEPLPSWPLCPFHSAHGPGSASFLAQCPRPTVTAFPGLRQLLLQSVWAPFSAERHLDTNVRAVDVVTVFVCYCLMLSSWTQLENTYLKRCEFILVFSI